MSLKADIKAVESIVSSRGWAIMKEAMEKEILAVAKSFGHNPNMSERETGFRAGSLFAAESFLTLPDKILFRLKGEHMEQSLKEEIEKKRLEGRPQASNPE